MFFKFPSTPHIALLGEIDIREDKLMTEHERDDFLNHAILIEEKIDGANLGISFDHEGNIILQNRGSLLQPPFFGQWKKLSSWLALHSDGLFECLEDKYILFGEWCYAQHSVFYDKLPDWFLAFDIFDKDKQRFLSSARRNEMLDNIAICRVPILAGGYFDLKSILELLNTSRFGSFPAEGLYMRYDQEDWLEQRCKIVRGTFIQAQDVHWSKTGIKPNVIFAS